MMIKLIFTGISYSPMYKQYNSMHADKYVNYVKACEILFFENHESTLYY